MNIDQSECRQNRESPGQGPRRCQKTKKGKELFQNWKCQVSALLYWLGEEIDDMLNSTNISSHSKKVFFKKLEEFFKAQKH